MIDGRQFDKTYHPHKPRDPLAAPDVCFDRLVMEPGIGVVGVHGTEWARTLLAPNAPESYATALKPFC